MLELLVTYLQTLFTANFPKIEQVYGLAETIHEENQSYPAVYCTAGEYKPIGELENYLYFRQVGDATEAESDEEAISGCDHYITRTYPMVAVAYIPKSVFNTDNAFIDAKIGNNIANMIRLANYMSLSAVTKADDIHAEITNISTDRKTVWEQEYTGIPMAARLDHVYASIEFDLVVSATESCLRNFDCNDDLIVVDGTTITIIIECNNMPTVFEVPSVNTLIVDARLIGGTLEKLFLFMGGTEQIGIGNVASYNAFTGTVTFVNDLGGFPVKVQLFH